MIVRGRRSTIKGKRKFRKWEGRTPAKRSASSFIQGGKENKIHEVVAGLTN